MQGYFPVLSEGTMFKKGHKVFFQNQQNLLGEKVGVTLFWVPEADVNKALSVPDYYAFAYDPSGRRPFTFKTLKEAQDFARNNSTIVHGQVPWQGE